MNGKVVAVLGAVLIAAVAGGMVFTNAFGLLGEPTGNIAKEALEMETGADLEVLKIESEGSLDRVVLSDGESVINTYVTADGKYIVQNPVSVSDYMGTLEAREDFLSCVSDQNARFFGIIAQNEELMQHTQMAQAQIQALGGITGIQDIFQGPGTEGFPEDTVLEHGVVWRLNGEIVPGIQTIPELEEATGCSYDAEIAGMD